MHLMRCGIFRCLLRIVCALACRLSAGCNALSRNTEYFIVDVGCALLSAHSHHSRAIRQRWCLSNRCEVACGLFVFVLHLNYVLRASAAAE